jgi:hypothetical protein
MDVSIDAPFSPGKRPTKTSNIASHTRRFFFAKRKILISNKALKKRRKFDNILNYLNIERRLLGSAIRGRSKAIP